MTPNTVKAQSHWVWTDKAEKQNPQRSKAGTPIWPHYLQNAPEKWLKDGLICDASEYIAEGQTDLFDYIKG